MSLMKGSLTVEPTVPVATKKSSISLESELSICEAINGCLKVIISLLEGFLVRLILVMLFDDAVKNLIESIVVEAV